MLFHGISVLRLASFSATEPQARTGGASSSDALLIWGGHSCRCARALPSSQRAYLRSRTCPFQSFRSHCKLLQEVTVHELAPDMLGHACLYGATWVVWHVCPFRYQRRGSAPSKLCISLRPSSYVVGNQVFLATLLKCLSPSGLSLACLPSCLIACLLAWLLACLLACLLAFACLLASFRACCLVGCLCVCLFV